MRKITEPKLTEDQRSKIQIMEVDYRISNLESTVHYLEEILSDTLQRISYLENEHTANRSSETK
jgi:hypothetical protein